MARIPKLILHAGLPKTGSSLIQGTLRRLRPTLREAGVAYIDRKSFLELAHYRSWAAYDQDSSEKTLFFDELQEVVEAERKMTTGGGAIVLVSNESIPGRIIPEYGDPF